MDCGAGTTPNEPVEPVPPEVSYTCKTAIKLHTGICNTNGCSDAGERITFGNEEVTDGTLTSGDAFDCDVNGDGTFDDKTERFYYVTDLDNETVVLIYYNNVTDGNPYNVYSYAYHSDNVNNMRPVTAASQLPTTEKWSNVSLKNPIRQITNNEGGTTTEAGTIATFNYSKYAARLLTYQEYKEAKNGCTSTGGLNSCNYLRENTRINSADKIKYGYWLETPQLSTDYIVYTFVGTISSVSKGNASNTAEFGVRPVIEVPKSEIEI